MKKLFTILFVLFVAGSNLFAQPLATYTGSGGGGITIVGVPNETVSTLQTVGFGTNTPCSSGGISGLTNDGVFTYAPGNAHLYFQITPNAGYALNITGFSAGLRRSNRGLQSVRYAYSLDGGATWIDDGVDHAPVNGGCGTSAVSSWGGGALPTGVSSTVTGIIIALYPFNPLSVGGVIQVNTINITGTVVASCTVPTAYTVTGGGSYCAGGTGVHIGLSNSDLGINYQLYNGGTAVGSAVAGTGSALDFGLLTAAGTYTVVGTNTIGGCTNNMTGSAVITINPLPVAFSVTGGGSYCAGGTGLHVGLSGSSTGVNYQLYNGSTAVGSVVAGTGLALDFGLQTVAGTYTVTATNTTTGCNDNMSGSAIIVINPLPSPITGATTICPATTSALSSTTGGGTWSSSNTTIATVGSLTGIVTGVTAGTATIVYTLGTGCSTSTVVTISSLTPNTGSNNVCIGSTITLSNATGGGTWSSSAPAVASVGAGTGIVSGNTVGTATISYLLGSGCYATTLVTVNPLPAAITGPAFVCQHLTISLSDVTVGGTWSSGAALVGSVSSMGTVTGIGTGGVTAIYYTLPTGCYATHFVTVNTPPAPITGVNEICQGGSTILVDMIHGGTWSSSAPLIAPIDAFGNVSGPSSGTTTISYTITGCPPVMRTVTVDPLPAAIGGLPSICSGRSVHLYDSSAGGIWSSSDVTVATISSTGVVTDVDTTLGATTIITYTLPTGCTTSISVSVHYSPALINGIDSICQGAVTTLTDSTPGGVWSSASLATAAIIDTSGIVRGISPGLVNISYTLPSGCFSVLPFTVETPIAATVNLTATPGDSVCAGTPIQFTASPLNAGTPSFVWRIFYSGTPSDSTGNTFTYTPIHGDVIICEMITHGVCAASDTVIDTITANVYPHVTPSITIRINDSTNIASYYGQVYTFFSNVTYGGAAQTFQWYVNGIAIPGATSRLYSTPVYKNDTFYCLVTGNPPCDTVTDSALSNRIIIYASHLGVNQLSGGSTTFSLFPNPNNGEFTLTGQLAANSGNNDIYFDVYDLLGQIIYRGNAKLYNGKVYEKVNLSENLPAGNYLLHITTGTVKEVLHLVISK